MKRDEKKIIGIISEVLNTDDNQINLKSASDNIKNWDSLNHVKLILACEEAFNIKFDVQDIDDLKNVKDLISLIENKASQ